MASTPHYTLQLSFLSLLTLWPAVESASMGLITGLFTFFYHFPQIYKWLLKPYYIISLLMTVAFLLVRKAPGLCEHLATQREDGNSCDFDWREWEILMFLCAIVMMKTEEPLLWSSTLATYSSSVKWPMSFSSSDSTSDLGSFTLCSALGELQQDGRIMWIVEFYANWSSDCQSFAPVFADLSLKYNCFGLRFGKVDVGRYDVVSQKYRVCTSPLTKQLPTLVLFQGGQEIMRRPMVDNKGRAIYWTFNEENIIREFNLNEIIQKCKKLKTRGLNEDGQNDCQPEEDSNEFETENQTESKKDQ
uniref:Thioredoxin-related transmembrane protein 2a n=1 Tax=Neogobius melanostomus TaxID=47308 RepID=A0A8C6TKQ1_9GOBI